MPFMNSLALLVMVAAFVFLVIYLVRLSKSIRTTLENLDETLSHSRKAVDSTLAQLSPVVSGLTELEKSVQETLGETNRRLALIEKELTPLLEELKNTAQVCQGLGRTLEKDIPPILDDVHQITGGVRDITGDIKIKVRQTQDFFNAAREAGETFRVASNVSRAGLSGLAVQVASMAAGIKTSLEFLSDNLTSKGDTKK